jgi:MerR family copper efflux transcriptional regulator
MLISALSEQTGVSAHRLRRYEALGLIRSERQANGYRVYTASTAREVVFIDMSKAIGFSLGEIAEVLPRYRSGSLTPQEMTTALQRKIQEIDEQIAAKNRQRQMLTDHIAWFKNRKRTRP